ncbi:hypothetical protein RHMOL_Rhmol05G0136800 [Rhododendron molle]|uniref:Uncharacterized protein n=3 Tax=Rhododendron molle TaxID=49168 RepID=A0ACC0NNL2_RHOML|nr:hypothetical protein RHMOL_Rhmol05G0136800 [Rhododendron molle]KAI8554962.1 hypothetical protein RHMOL_Rhmol05G0136800 [Rhododendron molle]KAI8554963.1 hypothetical protein RHMOL_Rhmol05G0136800 [Rhododendron molle]
MTEISRSCPFLLLFLSISLQFISDLLLPVQFSFSSQTPDTTPPPASPPLRWLWQRLHLVLNDVFRRSHSQPSRMRRMKVCSSVEERRLLEGEAKEQRFAVVSRPLGHCLSSDSSSSKDGTTTNKQTTSSSGTGSKILIICLVLVGVVLLSFSLFKFWQKKKREEQYARLLKLFEQDDELELELGLRD